MSLAAFGLQHDHVRRRRRVIGLDGGGDAAHMNRKMGLAEAAVFARRIAPRWRSRPSAQNACTDTRGAGRRCNRRQAAA